MPNRPPKMESLPEESGEDQDANLARGMQNLELAGTPKDDPKEAVEDEDTYDSCCSEISEVPKENLNIMRQLEEYQTQIANMVFSIGDLKEENKKLKEGMEKLEVENERLNNVIDKKNETIDYENEVLAKQFEEIIRLKEFIEANWDQNAPRSRSQSPERAQELEELAIIIPEDAGPPQFLMLPPGLEHVVPEPTSQGVTEPEIPKNIFQRVTNQHKRINPPSPPAPKYPTNIKPIHLRLTMPSDNVRPSRSGNHYVANKSQRRSSETDEGADAEKWNANENMKPIVRKPFSEPSGNN